MASKTLNKDQKVIVNMADGSKQIGKILDSSINRSIKRRVYVVEMENGKVYEDVTCDSSSFTKLNIDSELSEKFFKSK